MGLLVTLGLGVVGASKALWTAKNAQLARDIGPIRTACLFLVTGTIGAAIIAYVTTGAPFWTVLPNVPWYSYLPGLLNIVFVTMHMRVTGAAGATLAAASVFGGEMMTGLVLDHVGLFGLQTLSMTATRLAGTALLLVGVYVMADGRLPWRMKHRRRAGEVPAVAATDNRSRGTSSFAVFGGLGLGVLASFTIALNGVSGQLVGPFFATVLFLAPGALALTSYFIMRRPSSGMSMVTRLSWRHLVPGTLNIASVTGAIMLVPVIGVQLVTGGTFVAGMLTGMFIDAVGLFGLERRIVDGRRSLAAICLVVGVYLAAMV